jgi:hypothetical protein
MSIAHHSASNKTQNDINNSVSMPTNDYQTSQPY